MLLIIMIVDEMLFLYEQVLAFIIILSSSRRIV